MKPHERLIAWHHCHRLALVTYRITRTFPKTEEYGMTSQMRRAASSAAANLVEGAAKRGSREFRRFIDTALGSLAEVSYFALLAKDLELLSQEQWEELSQVSDEAGRTTMGLYKAIARRAANGGRVNGKESVSLAV
ncbi:MAG TPA: four helix bundle protein [Gemmatimonadales bacterium]|nr:four helix bundle protein [Gemmatimonadales bacterium]